MKLGAVLHEPKRGPEFPVKLIGVVAHNIQATALGRTFGPERRNDDVDAGFDGMADLPYIGCAVIGISQEVVDRSIVPHIVLMQA